MIKVITFGTGETLLDGAAVARRPMKVLNPEREPPGNPGASLTEVAARIVGTDR